MKNTKNQMPTRLLLLLSSFLFLFVFRINASEQTGRPARIVSLCFSAGYDFPEMLKIVDQEGSRGTDIIILPETWRGQSQPETLEGETITALSELAKKHKTYILSPIDRKDGKFRYNSAVLINREGRVVFIYDKVYVYWGEFDLKPPVDPGIAGAPVFETDFGKIGIAICFDANFPEVWQALKDNGAEIVFFPSAYSAGSQLQAYALLHHYYIVTSTYTKDCQVYDITGERILDDNGIYRSFLDISYLQKSDNITIARITLDLDRGIYHYNFNRGKLDNLLKAHGEEVENETGMPREAWFVLRAIKPGVSARLLAKKFEMEELNDYQNRSRREIDKKRGYNFAKTLNIFK